MNHPEPLPESAVVLDSPARYGAYLAVPAQVAGQFCPRWHVWHVSGAYAGYCTTPGLVSLVIAQHQPKPDPQ